MRRFFGHLFHVKSISRAVKLHNFISVNQIIQVLTIILLSLNILPSHAQSEWKLEKSGKGINVYTREIPETSIKEFRAEVEIKASIGELEEALSQVENHAEWMAGVESATVLNTEPEILQYNLHLPFPFSDRYVVVTSKTVSGEGSCRIIIERLDHPPINAEGDIEIEYLKGYWLFTKVDEQTTAVVYQFVSDPGGSLPDWLVNSFIVKNPYHTLANLREKLLKVQ